MTPGSPKGRRTRGIGLNLASPVAYEPVSPLLHKRKERRELSELDPNDVNKVHRNPRIMHEKLLEEPEFSKENYHEMELQEQLRILALKEMRAVELKDKIAEMELQLVTTELELAQMRQVVLRSLQRDMRRTKRKRRPRMDNQDGSRTVGQTESQSESPVGAQKEVESGLEKENEVLKHEHLGKLERQDKGKAAGLTSVTNSMDLIESKLNNSANPEHEKSWTFLQRDMFLELEKLDTRLQESQVLATVSNSIWTFVNDVKSSFFSPDDD